MRLCESCERPLPASRRQGRRCGPCYGTAPRKRLDLFTDSDGLCARLPGKCEFLRCRHNLDGESMTEKSNAIRKCNDNCVIRVANAESDGMTLNQVGEIMGVSRERIRQIEALGLRNAAKVSRELYGKISLVPPLRGSYDDTSF